MHAALVGVGTTLALLSVVAGWLLDELTEPYEPEPCEAPETAAEPVSDCFWRDGDAYLRHRLGTTRGWTVERNPGLSRFEAVREHCITKPDSCAGPALVPHAYLLYDFRVPGKPFVEELLSVRVAFNGSVLPSTSEGLPDCRRVPQECEFPVDEDDAKRVAQRGGLESGVWDWATSFHFYRDRSFVGTVSNTLSGEGNTLEGRMALIDANDGRLWGIGWWGAVAD